jgi:SAM-dependent methyltransferase
MTAITSTADYTAIKARQHDAWASGDYAVIGTTLQIVGESLAEAVDIQAGELVLDVAAGNGNASLAAARRGAAVTATDYVTSLLDRARARAASEGLTIDTERADAEALPFPDGGFDAVLSTFGVMFAPDQERAAAELVRACRPGGRIGLANWTPSGFIGQMFKTVGRHVSPPAGVRPPVEWGDEARLRELFDTDIESLAIHRRQFIFRYRSAEHMLETFRTYYGPILKAFAAVDDGARVALERDLLALLREYNTSSTGTLRVPSDYLEVVAVKAPEASGRS